jgi:hypothetical protein
MIDRRTILAASAGTAATAIRHAAFAGSDDQLDTAWINARVWTGAGPDTRTDAIGVKGDRIAAIGADAVRARTGKRTRVIDLQGAFVTPGFIDPHVHFVMASTMLTQASLRDAANRKEFVERIAIAAKALPKGQWLEGGNWDQDRWGGEMPHRKWIDAVTPDTPVAVIRYDLHMLFLNSLALRLAGIDRNTVSPPGGVIEKDDDGEPTGIIKDSAKDRVLRAIGERTPAQIDAAVAKGIEVALSKGVTQVHPTELETISFDSTRRLRARVQPVRQGRLHQSRQVVWSRARTPAHRVPAHQPVPVGRLRPAFASAYRAARPGASSRAHPSHPAGCRPGSHAVLRIPARAPRSDRVPLGRAAATSIWARTDRRRSTRASHGHWP